jgi:hypothetical protein
MRDRRSAKFRVSTFIADLGCDRLLKHKTYSVETYQDTSLHQIFVAIKSPNWYKINANKIENYDDLPGNSY